MTLAHQLGPERGAAAAYGATIVTGRETCKIADIVRSGPPPEKPRKARKRG